MREVTKVSAVVYAPEQQEVLLEEEDPVDLRSRRRTRSVGGSSLLCSSEFLEVWWRLGCDAVASMATAGVVAPLTAFLDRGITESAAGKRKLWSAAFASAAEAAMQPRIFLRSPQFLWPFALYAGTYFAANGSESLCALSGVAKAGPQLAAATSTNMALCVAKDRAFARLFGTIAPTSLPAASYALWLGRDLASMYFFFTLPPLLAAAIASFFLKKNDDPTNQKASTASSAARFLSPVAAQLVTTPLHLMGLDFYNRRLAKPADRIAFLRREFPVTLTARVARIMPAYSLGGVLNAYIRTNLTSSSKMGAGKGNKKKKTSSSSHNKDNNTQQTTNHKAFSSFAPQE